MLRIVKTPNALPKTLPTSSVTRLASTQSQSGLSNSTKGTKPASDLKDSSTSAQSDDLKTQAQKDAELRQKLEEMSGGGGEAGLELENGKPVAMKRSVKENMFRLI